MTLFNTAQAERNITTAFHYACGSGCNHT